jgi:hypothetical protein
MFVAPERNAVYLSCPRAAHACGSISLEAAEAQVPSPLETIARGTQSFAPPTTVAGGVMQR